MKNCAKKYETIVEKKQKESDKNVPKNWIQNLFVKSDSKKSVKGVQVEE